MISKEILEIANKANLEIIENDKSLIIKHKFSWKSKSIWGVFLFLCGGVFFIIVPFIKATSITTKTIAMFIGLFLLVLSILAIIRVFCDELKISDSVMTFCYNLKRTTIPYEDTIRVRMKKEIFKMKRIGTLGSEYIIVSHYLQDYKNEITLLSFQMNSKDSNNAIILGNEITKIINKKADIKLN